MVTEAATQRPTGERQRVVWWAHVARGSAAIVVLFARFMFEFREQTTLVKVFTFATPIPLGELPATFAYEAYKWPRDHLSVDPGTAAVGMFFMLSGFVIPFALERRTMSAFGIRRVLRVYPTLWVATALSLLAIWITTHGSPFPVERAQVVTSGTLVSQYAGKNWIDPSYWTIPIEELFYVCAAILAATRLLRRPAVLMATATIVASVGLLLGRVLPDPGGTPDVTFWMRFWVGRNLCFMTFIWVGVALHMLYRGFWKRSTFAAVAAYVCVVFFFALHNGPFQHPYLPDDQAVTFFNSFMVGLGVFLILYVIGDRIPKNRPMQTLGDMSYPVYLTVTVIGWTVLLWLTNALGYLWALPVAAAVTLLIAFLLHKLVEKPTYALAQRITAKPRFRSTRSWSDPARRRRGRGRGPTAQEPVSPTPPVPSPAPTPVGFNLATSEGNGQAPDGSVGAAEPEPTS